jgi:protoheme IX farnesyltransferase
MAPMLQHYFRLTKPGITASVLLTTVLGYYLGARGGVSFGQLFFLLSGAALTCAGSSVLNQYWEREWDGRMPHTMDRPLPSGKIPAENALTFGVLLVFLGVIELAVSINLLTAFLSLLTAFIYVVVYTPFKRVSWLNTSLGAIAGALPPVGGWAAATGHLTWGAWALFLILYVWQHPHFYAIAWMLRENYRRGGFMMLPVIDVDGRRIFKHILAYALILVPVSLLPVVMGLSGAIYGVGVTVLGAVLVALSLRLFCSRGDHDARTLFRATVAYLPIILCLVIVDACYLKGM